MYTYLLEPHRWRMVSVFASIEVDRGFEPRSGQTKDYKIGMCCFSAKERSIHEKEQRFVQRGPHHHLIEN